jgi:hypothetical protein
MDKYKLRKKLQPFQDKCKEEGFNVKEIIISQEFPDLDIFFINVCIPDMDDENYEDVWDETFKILRDTIDEETLDYVSTYCVDNDCDEYPMQYCKECQKNGVLTELMDAEAMLT